MHVEFWFDFSCPYAYLASGEIEAICQAAGAVAAAHDGRHADGARGRAGGRPRWR